MFESYGQNTRDLYDNIIDQIKNGPETMQNKRAISRINNIFDEYAGVTIGERGFQAPEGMSFQIYRNSRA